MRKALSIATLSLFCIFFGMVPCAGQLSDALKLKVSGNSYGDETVIRFLDASTAGFDSNYDAWKLFSSNKNVPSFFTKEKGGKALSINAAGKTPADTAIPVFLRIPAAGTYTISTLEVGQFAANMEITITNLASGESYSITKDTSFIIRYAALNLDTIAAKFLVGFNTRALSGPCQLVQVHSGPVKCYGESNGKIFLNNKSASPMNYVLEKGSFTKTGNIHPGCDSIDFLAVGKYTLKITNAVRTDTFTVSIEEPAQVIADFNLAKDTVYLDAGGQVVTSNNSVNSTQYEWSFGDGTATVSQFSPSHKYSLPGSYTVTLLAKNSGCSSWVGKQVYVVNSVTTSVQENKIRILQEHGIFQVDLSGLFEKAQTITVFDLSGKAVLHSDSSHATGSIFQIPLGIFTQGVYILSVITENHRISSTFTVQNDFN